MSSSARRDASSTTSSATASSSRASRPELTREEAVEEIRRNREQELARLEALAARNVAATPDRGLQSIAQIQGRLGGIESGALRQEQVP